MQAPSAGSPATHRRGGRVWLWIAVVWCAFATAVALWQPPGPVGSAMPVTRVEHSLWDWWRLPVERHAFLRLPDLRGPFTSMAVGVGGDRWWLLGNQGASVETVDGGTTWHQVDGVGPSEPTGTRRLQDLTIDGARMVMSETGRLSVFVPDRPGWSRPLVAFRSEVDETRAWALGDSGNLIMFRDDPLSWSLVTRGALDALTSVGFSDDGQRGWTLGASGTVLRSEDGGSSWRRQPTGSSTGLSLLHVSADGMKAWAGYADGKLAFETLNGGASWEPGDFTSPDAQAAMVRPRASLRPPMPLPWGVRSGYIGADGLRGWAVGDGGLLLTTRDGGRSWTDPRRYARYPAPWYWLALLLSVPMFLRAWRHFTQAHQAVIGMADTPATDAALTDPRQDRLNFEPLAAGISRFLRNPATEPPLTLAITGDWGSGKSSLMGLICADLREHGSRPIWFNAWHHQKEDHLFAALLGALSKQAPPPWLSLDGIGFRLRLLWVRSRKHWVFTLLLCTAVAALVTLHLGMNDAVAETQRLRQLGDLLTSLGGWGARSPMRHRPARRPRRWPPR
ncbi:P-loop NTPase fold protein [Roseateles chitinivorans]|uniref:WD40/YVTN/BNR-like repeat-containing protein n=1 Tax=Roseateles chitinivorans TaxID=2917965 RepID=UPI003D67F96A